MHKRIREDLGRFESPLLLPEELMTYLRLNAQQLQLLVQEGAISALPLGSIGVRFHRDQVVDDLEAIELRVVEQAPEALPEPVSARPQLAAPEAPLVQPPPTTEPPTGGEAPGVPAAGAPVQEDKPRRLYEPDGPILYPPRQVAVPSVLPIIKQLPDLTKYLKLNGQQLADYLGIAYVTMLGRLRKGDDLLTSVAELEKTDPTQHEVIYVVNKDQADFFRQYYEENPHKNSYAWKRRQDAEARAQVTQPEQPPQPAEAPHPKADTAPAPVAEPERQRAAEPRSLYDEVQRLRQASLPKPPVMQALKRAPYNLQLRGRFAAANHCGLAIGTFNDLIKSLVEEGRVHIDEQFPGGIKVEVFLAGELEDLRQQFHPLAREARGEIERVPARRASDSSHASNY